MKKWLICFLLISESLYAAVKIDNGIDGDGFWQVKVLRAGNTREAIIDPNGPIGQQDLVFKLISYIDVGIDNQAFNLGGTVEVRPYLNRNNQVVSSGVFEGPNGPVKWESFSYISPGSYIYTTKINFRSKAPFGDIRFISYLDANIPDGNKNDILIEIGEPGQVDFQLLMLDQDEDYGVAHAVSYYASGATYIGWAGGRLNITTGYSDGYAIDGVIDTTRLPPYSDSRYPSNEAFGPANIGGAFAFDFNPRSTIASVTIFLGASPDGLPPNIIQRGGCLRYYPCVRLPY